MLWSIASILLAFWLLGALLKIGGALIHLLLVLAVIAVVMQLIRRSRATNP